MSVPSSSPNKSNAKKSNNSSASTQPAANTTNTPQTTNSNSNTSTAEYNPRWKGYLMLLLTSLINFSAISNIADDNHFDQESVSLLLCFGIISFSYCFLTLLLDRTQCFGYWKEKSSSNSNNTNNNQNRNNNNKRGKKAKNSRLEGYSLLFFVIWWIVGVSYMTQVNGVAYAALNVYFSAWLSLAAAVFTMNKWMAAQEKLLSFADMTSVSATIKSWYVLLLSSVIVTGSSLDMVGKLSVQEVHAAAFGIAFGASSSLLAFLFILVHYRFIELFEAGGWIELFGSFLAIFMWIVGVAVMTQDGGIGATIVGTTYRNVPITIKTDFEIDANDPNCRIVIFPSNTTIDCDQVIQESEVPGSNLYLSSWTCLVASLNITLRWKAQQALLFAQAQQARRREETEENDVDMDEFVDAVDESE